MNILYKKPELKKGKWSDLEEKAIIYTKYDPVGAAEDVWDGEIEKGRVYAVYLAKNDAKEDPLDYKIIEDIRSMILDSFELKNIKELKTKEGKYAIFDFYPTTEENLLKYDKNIMFAGSYGSTFICEKNLKNAIIRYAEMYEWQKKQKKKLDEMVAKLNVDNFKEFIFEEIVDPILCKKDAPYMHDFYANYLKNISKNSKFEVEVDELIKLTDKFDIKDQNDPNLEIIKKQVDVLDMINKEEYEKIPAIKNRIKSKTNNF